MTWQHNDPLALIVAVSIGMVIGFYAGALLASEHLKLRAVERAVEEMVRR